MQIVMNGKPLMTTAKTILDLTRIMELESDYIAVAINKNFVPRRLFKSTTLQELDEVEIVSPMTGG